MTRTKPFLASVILMAGLTSACGQSAATAEDGAENAAESQSSRENAAAPEDATDMAGAANAAVPAAVEATSATVAPASAPEKTTAVGYLPLRPGQYVNSEARCDQAGSWAMVALVSRTGMNLDCTFKKIEKTGPTTYRVTSECLHSGASWGHEDSVEISTNTYEIPNETSFKVTYEGGSEVSARYCAQVSAGGM